MVLVVHGGGFVGGEPADMKPVVSVFRDEGFRARAVPYTLGDIRAAHRDIREAVDRFPRRRDVFVYGESAGGTLAALMARGRRVDGAAAHSPLVDLTGHELERNGWEIGCSRLRCRKTYSPALGPVRRRVLTFVPTEDRILDPRPALRWAERKRRVKAISYPGRHMFPSWRGRNGDLRRTALFFERRVAAKASQKASGT